MKSRRSITRAINRLQRRIDSHQEKLKAEPNAPAAGHWRREIRNFSKQIAGLRKRLGRA